MLWQVIALFIWAGVLNLLVQSRYRWVRGVGGLTFVIVGAFAWWSLFH